jgi:hypothetical protein
MKTIICDLCGEKITGEYKEVFNSHTEGIAKCTAFHNDVCDACWNAFTRMKRIPVVEFPNSEAKHE